MLGSFDHSSKSQTFEFSLTNNILKYNLTKEMVTLEFQRLGLDKMLQVDVFQWSELKEKQPSTL